MAPRADRCSRVALALLVVVGGSCCSRAATESPVSAAAAAAAAAAAEAEAAEVGVCIPHTHKSRMDEGTRKPSFFSQCYNRNPACNPFDTPLICSTPVFVFFKNRNKTDSGTRYKRAILFVDHIVESVESSHGFGFLRRGQSRQHGSRNNELIY